MFILPKIKKGFTLIELLVVISVIAILAVIVLYGLNIAQGRARDTQRAAIMRAVQNGLQSYFTDKAVYPTVGASWMATLFPNYVAGSPALACQGAPADRALCTYLTAALTDPGCGATLTTSDVRANSAPCGSVAYSYATTPSVGGCPTGSLYELKLVKESGGNQFFCPPQ